MNINKKLKGCSLFILLLAGMNNVFAQDTEFYVAPLGRNSNDGSKEKPWKTVEFAKKQARTIDGKVSICLYDGTYTLNKTLELTYEDSNVNYKAVEGDNPVISGGIEVKKWRKGKNGIWHAKVPKGI